MHSTSNQNKAPRTLDLFGSENKKYAVWWLDAIQMNPIASAFMKFRMRCIYLSLFVLAAAASTPLSGQVTYREGEGWSVSDGENVADAASAAAQFDLARQAEDAGNLKRALAAYRKVVKRFPRTDQARDAAFKVGQLYEKAGDFSRAFDAYQKLIDDYPGSSQFNEAVEAQFKIATLYLEGERQRLLGIPTFASMSRAQEMFESIIKNAPFTKYAPLSQFNLGMAYEKQGKTPEAIAAYQTVIDRYTDSDLADDALYQIAYVFFQQARAGSNDKTVLQKARDGFQDFLLRYPDSEKAKQAEANLKLLEGRKTQSAIEVARFYDKSRQYKAAVIYYNVVLQQQPGSPEAEEAERRIDEIRGQVGEEALQVGVEKAETGQAARARRKLQAQLDTAARADYVGPPAPVVPDEVEPELPRMRTSPDDVAPLPPAVEPDLPLE